MTQTETSELRPCPFCGGEAVIVETSGTAWKDREGEYIICDKECKRVWMEANEKTITLWNTRPTEEILENRINTQKEVVLLHIDAERAAWKKYDDLRARLKKAVEEIKEFTYSKTDDGTEIIGERNGRAKLHDEDVYEIRRLRAHGVSHDLLAKMFCVGKSTIGGICCNRNWAHLLGEVNK